MKERQKSSMTGIHLALTGMMGIPLIELETIVIRVGLVAGNQEFCFGHFKIENPSDRDVEMSYKQ